MDTQASEGFSPVSLAIFGTLVYVVNAGNPENSFSNPDNISGFRLNENGTLSPIPGSTRPLSENITAPAQIRFNREGTVLLFTEKATNSISTYTVNGDGTPGTFHTRTAAVPIPFGFSFGDRDTVFITEANQGNAGVIASYRVNRESGTVTGPRLESWMQRMRHVGWSSPMMEQLAMRPIRPAQPFPSSELTLMGL